jgi:hypothetical protein
MLNFNVFCIQINKNFQWLVYEDNFTRRFWEAGKEFLSPNSGLAGREMLRVERGRSDVMSRNWFRNNTLSVCWGAHAPANCFRTVGYGGGEGGRAEGVRIIFCTVWLQISWRFVHYDVMSFDVCAVYVCHSSSMPFDIFLFYSIQRRIIGKVRVHWDNMGERSYTMGYRGTDVAKQWDGGLCSYKVGLWGRVHIYTVGYGGEVRSYTVGYVPSHPPPGRVLYSGNGGNVRSYTYNVVLRRRGR